MIYLVVFLSSVLLVYLGEKAYIKSKILSCMVFFCALLIPSILAGCRSPVVGTDTGAYIYYFEVIRDQKSIIDAWTNPYLLRVGLEQGYVLLNFIVSRFVGNGHYMLGVLAFLTNLCILIGARNYKNKYPSWFIMLLYYFVFASVTFNIARQGLANAIIFSGAILLEQKKYRKYILVVLLAYTIHNTALISGMLLLFVFIYLERKQSFFRSAALLFLIAVGMVLYQIPMNLLLNVFPSYASYAIEYGGKEATFSLLGIIIKAPCIIMATLYFRQADTVSPHYYVYYVFLWIDLLISQFGAFLGPLARIAYYFAYYKLLIVPEIYYSYYSKKSSSSYANSRIFIALAVIWVIVYWDIMAVHNLYGYGNPVYPYVSEILNIH